MWHQQQAAGSGKAAPFHLAGWEIQAPGHCRVLEWPWRAVTFSGHTVSILVPSLCPMQQESAPNTSLPKGPSAHLSKVLQWLGHQYDKLPAFCCTLWCPAATQFSLKVNRRHTAWQRTWDINLQLCPTVPDSQPQSPSLGDWQDTSLLSPHSCLGLMDSSSPCLEWN